MNRISEPLLLSRCPSDRAVVGTVVRCALERWDITVVAGQPNKNLTGQEFVRRGQQKRDGVTIYRLPPTTRPKRSKVGRLITVL
ncbi:hypothetical protein CA51_20210 [Rosistilla oblonga]|uniref:hypothetical protein n=1 Tax=Rosistilla oblonga TaxID=2527990 RepID=UPI00118B109D|nr:hypothetical protein [Rosistilla oblonga]QDV12145.1 hypothetical protein CA51_20210 [Rosistilla oblonga]